MCHCTTIQGEEWSTTMAVGEEDPLEPRVSTQAVGEECPTDHLPQSGEPGIGSPFGGF